MVTCRILFFQWVSEGGLSLFRQRIFYRMKSYAVCDPWLLPAFSHKTVIIWNKGKDEESPQPHWGMDSQNMLSCFVLQHHIALFHSDLSAIADVETCRQTIKFCVAIYGYQVAAFKVVNFPYISSMVC